MNAPGHPVDRAVLRRLLLLALPLIAGACEVPNSYPVDPEGTLDRVRGGTLRAGVIHAPPWVVADGAGPAGPEAALVRRLAAELGAEIEWQRGGPDQMLALLEERALDILIGGFELHSPATRKVGTTRSYATVAWWIVTRDATAVGSIEGERVSVRHGRAAVLVRAAGGIPMSGKSAADELALRAIPLVGSAPVPDHPVQEIGSSEHVLAVPPGENAWLVAIDRSLHASLNEKRRVPTTP